MAKVTLFNKVRNIYWPEEYDGLVTFLRDPQARSQEQESSGREMRVFPLNVHVITFAAVVGLVEGRKKEVTKDRKEIATHIFESNGLAEYLYLVPLLASKEPELDLMRGEIGEERSIRLFEQYACGGLEILQEKRIKTLHQQVDMFVTEILRDYGVRFDQQNDGANNTVKLFR